MMVMMGTHKHSKTAGLKIDVHAIVVLEIPAAHDADVDARQYGTTHASKNDILEPLALSYMPEIPCVILWSSKSPVPSWPRSYTFNLGCPRPYILKPGLHNHNLQCQGPGKQPTKIRPSMGEAHQKSSRPRLKEVGFTLANSSRLAF